MRHTIQTNSVIKTMAALGHASNQEIARRLRKDFPNITATTVHRITKRLVEEGILAYAPSFSSTMIVDSNTSQHDHFCCQGCDRLVDIILSDELISQLQAQLPSRLGRKQIAVSGICEQCT